MRDGKPRALCIAVLDRNLQLVCKWVRMKDRRALSLIADVELTFRSPLYAFFVPLSYRIRPSLEHPEPVTALSSCHLKYDNRIKYNCIIIYLHQLILLKKFISFRSSYILFVTNL